MDSRIVERQAWKEAAGFVIVVVLIVLVFALLVGCSQIQPSYDSKGRLDKVSSFKTPLMGDLSFESEETTTNPKTGEITTKRVKTSTSTNADKIIDSTVKGIGTAVNAAEKAGAAMP